MSDDRQEPPAGDDDATRPIARDPGDLTQPGPVNQTLRQPAVPPAWSGRAGVPPPRPVGGAEAEWYTEEQAERRWWMPILLGILALALLALIGLGVWLALSAAERDPGQPPSPSAVPSSTPETSAAPTTTAASTSPSATAPSAPPTTTLAARGPMPPLVGLPEAAARAVLDGLDVPYQVQRRASEQPAGTVIETDPAAGEPIAAGEPVTIVVAEAVTPATGASSLTSGPTGTPAS
ncbi:PASTA domain-containing protein [Micromonospora viridifaciens]|uniref:PASTA domain-containing protein n=1 Tax=Micromonospora viridifaciens TaxID=1881 RepID=A0A1C4UC57_MICVI|nr:PASTA domain-containing protein [Micromonospora viridifaciens]SCE69244.1 PASTA domain-containing protein [Micromonospora viridifaciens]